MDFGKALSFVTADKNWFKKLAMGGLFLLLGFTTPIVVGWWVETIHRVSSNHAEPLPGWEDIGGYFMKGLKLVGVGLVWMLPAFLLIGCALAVVALSGQNLDFDTAQTLNTVVLICASGMYSLYFIALALLLLPLPGLVAEGRGFGELLRPNLAFGLFKKNAGGFLLTALAGGFLSNLIASVGVIACFIGVLITTPFGLAVYGHLMGQAHAKATGALALEPAP
ncbi:MAG: DUF4013 domain-containing protein [Chloroflexi bacterium]|nr:DUF4013 domain-containing protein [Chloroflexota bacterium]